MANQNYLQWLVNETPTTWWHDSAEPGELDAGLANAATGVTTNPVLTHRAVTASPDLFRDKVGPRDPALSPSEWAEKVMSVVVKDAAAKLVPQHSATGGELGYVCAQVNPAKASDRDAMLAMAQRYHTWAPNIAVKLPVTLAGLDVLEECTAQGITVTATVSFCVPQVVSIAERHRQGVARARAAGITPGHCFSVIMIGRLDDYLRDVAVDNGAGLAEEDITKAGLAVSKRAYSIYKEQGYEAVLLVAALRGNYHMTELAGAELIMSIHPRNQGQLLEPGVPREERIGIPVAAGSIERLQTLPEFVRSYEPDGMAPEDFVRYGATQRTLTQFNEVGWSLLESFAF